MSSAARFDKLTVLSSTLRLGPEGSYVEGRPAGLLCRKHGMIPHQTTAANSSWPSLPKHIPQADQVFAVTADLDGGTAAWTQLVCEDFAFVPQVAAIVVGIQVQRNVE